MKSRIIFTFVSFSFLALFIYSCAHIPNIPNVPIPPIQPGYEKDSWSRSEDGLSVLPKVDFSIKEKKVEKTVAAQIKESEDVKEYSSEIASCFIEKPFDLDEAEKLVDDMISDCKGEDGVDKVIFRYLSTLIYIQGNIEHLKYNASSIRAQVKDIKKDKINFSEIYKHDNEELKKYFPDKNLDSEGLENFFDLEIANLKKRIKEAYVKLRKNNSTYSDEDLLKLSMYCLGYDFFFVDRELSSSDCYKHEGTAFPSLYLAISEGNMPVYRTGEKVCVRAYSYFISEDYTPELEFSIYKTDPVSLFREKISFDDIKPPSNAKLIKKWKHSIKGEGIEYCSFYDLDESFKPFDTGLSILEIIPEPPEPVESQYSFGPEYDIEVPVKEAGFYIVGMSNGFYTKYTPVLVSDLNIMTKYDGDILLSYCDSRRARKQLDNNKDSYTDKNKIIFTIAREDKVLKRLSSGKRGVCAIRTSGDASKGFVIASLGDHHAFADINTIPHLNKKRRSFIYTDRPLYRPGNKVQVKVISREIDLETGSYTIPAKGPVKIKVMDPQNNIFKTVELNPNEFGTCTMEFKLDKEAPLGKYTVTAGEKYKTCQFNVKEYRKPECDISVNFSETSAIEGDPVKVIVTGKYYHGKPMNGRSVDIAVKGKSEVLSSKLDKNGVWIGEVDTGNLGSSWLYVTADVTDVSGRCFLATNTLRLHSSGVKISVESPDGCELEPKNEIEVEINTKDYKNNLISNEVLLNITRKASQDGNNSTEVIVKDKKIKTGNKGKTVYQFPGIDEGKYEISVTTSDSKGRKAEDCITVQVRKKEKKEPTGPGPSPVIDEIMEPVDISLPKSVFNPSENTVLKIAGNTDSGNYFCTLDTVKINSFFFVPYGKPYELKISDDSSISALGLNAYAFQNGSLDYTSEKVSLTGNTLDVKLLTPNEVYEPAEKVDLKIETRKYNGENADSEISLAVVDKSVLDLSKIKIPEIDKVLFKGIKYDIPVETAFKIPYKMGVKENIFPSPVFGSRSSLGNKCYGGFSRKRKNFKDTGYWNPGLLTGKDGDWNGSFKMPDDLTAWQVKAVAVTKDGKAGQGIKEIITASDFIVRLIFPRTFTEGDTALVSAVIDNFSEEDKKCNLVFEYKNCKLLAGKLAQPVKVPAESNVKVNWKIRVNSTKPVVLSAVASAAENFGDGEERIIPVIPLGAVIKILKGGTFTKYKDIAIDIPEDVLPESVELNVDFQASPKVANLLSGLKYLVDYPYGCVEQTMSRFMPAMAAETTMNKLEIYDPELQNKVKKCVSQSLNKLYGYQHTDGGWGWWKNDTTNSFLTAYVLYGFSVTKDAGYEIDQSLLERGLECLVQRIKDEKDMQMKVFMMMAYSYWKKPKEEWINELYKNRKDLGNFGLGALLIACKKSEKDNYIPELIKIIEQRAEKHNGVSSWNTEGMKLTSGKVQSTAFMLKALLMGDPENLLVIEAVNYLVENQKGGRWSNTKDSAAATVALASYLKKSKSLDGKNVNGTCTVNNQKPEKFSVKKDFSKRLNILKCDMKSLMKGENVINLKCKGEQRYGYSSILKYRSNESSKKMVENGLIITRNYELIKSDKSGNIIKKALNEKQLIEMIRQGDIIKVKIKIKHHLKNAKYLMLEDYFPAGFEVIEGEERNTQKGKTFTRLEVRDEKVVFFLTDLPDKEVVLSYTLRAETPGIFTANPASGELMYHPHVNGHSAVSKFRINEKKEE